MCWSRFCIKIFSPADLKCANSIQLRKKLTMLSLPCINMSLGAPLWAWRAKQLNILDVHYGCLRKGSPLNSFTMRYRILLHKEWTVVHFKQQNKMADILYSALSVGTCSSNVAFKLLLNLEAQSDEEKLWIVCGTPRTWLGTTSPDETLLQVF